MNFESQVFLEQDVKLDSKTQHKTKSMNDFEDFYALSPGHHRFIGVFRQCAQIKPMEETF